jgi:hypothetical protein
VAVFSTTTNVGIMPSDALEACQQAAMSFGWKVTSLSSTSITVVDKVQDLGMNPVTITVEFSPSENGTSLTLNAHIRGLWGGNNHMKGRVGQLVNAVSVASKSQKAPSPSSANKSFTEELKLLTEMHQLGQLTDEEFTAAKSKILEK